MMFVVRSVRCSAPVRPRRCTVSVSSSPSRIDAAATGWSRSSDPASRASTRAARSAESRFHASRNALPRTEACSRSGRSGCLREGAKFYVKDSDRVRRARRHSSAGANPARQLSLQPVAVGADDGGNDIG